MPRVDRGHYTSGMHPTDKTTKQREDTSQTGFPPCHRQATVKPSLSVLLFLLSRESTGLLTMVVCGATSNEQTERNGTDQSQQEQNDSIYGTTNITTEQKGTQEMNKVAYTTD